ncbi:hypothetical protein SmJEL517_g00295 [Synchytrium microbalum]|uniref:Nuclear pore protein n=1 Tax=Synchytrium microbalum TaxID=1806994 RepID=A0A507CEZ7_9FUNG|nr:uncharacterized protein SmJEL517_g00295 [Synchytrium microbalum]TPX38061.1 hypothetical protein SmJEL517_g00295 [Synchytrium microbalum]
MEARKSDFSSILQSSTNLTTHIAPGIPQINLNLNQIHTQSKTLREKTRASQRTNAAAPQDVKVTRLFAETGVSFNSERVQHALSQISAAAQIVEPASIVGDTDVEGYLADQLEKSIYRTVERTRIKTQKDFDARMDATFQRVWAEQKRLILEDISSNGTDMTGIMAGGATPVKSWAGGMAAGKTPASMSMTPAGAMGGMATTGNMMNINNTPLPPQLNLNQQAKLRQYANVVASINNSRIKDDPYKAMTTFREVASKVNVTNDIAQKQLGDCWSYLIKVFESGGPSAITRQEEQIKPESSLIFRAWLVRKGREYLQEQMWAHVQLDVQRMRAPLGALPPPEKVVAAWVKSILYRFNKWTASPPLVVVNDTPIWAQVFYLVRTGHTAQALAFVETRQNEFENEFVTAFKAWVESPDRRISRPMRDLITSVWSTRFAKPAVPEDPYKVALFKLLGRCELSKKNPGQEVASNAEDYLWYQLCLVQEDTTDLAPPEKYTIRDVAKHLMGFGSQHFAPPGKPPTIWFQILLLCGEFERAVEHLAAHPDYGVEGIHFAIALAYHQALRVPESPYAADVGLEMCVIRQGAHYEVVYLNFVRLLQSYVKFFAKSDPADAVNYYNLIGLYAAPLGEATLYPTPRGPGSGATPGSRQTTNTSIPSSRDYARALYNILIDLILATRDFKTLIGESRPDGTRSDSVISKSLSVIHIKSQEEFSARLVRPAAERAEKEGRWEDALKLRDLAGDYDDVVGLLISKLGDGLMMRASTAPFVMLQEGGAASPLTVVTAPKEVEEAVKNAESLADYYKKRPNTASKISDARQSTLRILLDLHKFYRAYEAAQPEASDQYHPLRILPTTPDVTSTQQKAEQAKALDASIMKSFAYIILHTMGCLYLLYTAAVSQMYVDAAREERIREFKARSKAIALFTGVLQFRMAADAYSRLMRFVVYME